MLGSFSSLKESAEAAFRTASDKLSQQSSAGASDKGNERAEEFEGGSKDESKDESKDGSEEGSKEESKEEGSGVTAFSSLKVALAAAVQGAAYKTAGAAAVSGSRQSDDGDDGGGGGEGPAESRPSLNGGTRPLRLGSFDFDNPEANDSSSLSSRRQTSPLSFPPLFHEADDMLNLANLIYTLVDLRNLARNGGLNDPDQSKRILDVPLPLGRALHILSTEGVALKESLDEESHTATLSALESLLRRQGELKEKARARKEAEETKTGMKKEGSVFGWITHWGASSSKEGGNDVEVVSRQLEEIESSVITAIGDVKNEEELVYAVGINPVEERITVIFRGSATKADFVTDAKISIVRAPDPRRFNGATTDGDGADDGGDVGIHQGFYEYLFGEPDGRPSKYAEIMRHINGLLEEKPARKKYKLYVTGHSLGGALSTLFGFYAAGSSSALPLPVTVVSVASPRVGNVDFARTFVEMESRGLIRHLRIANHQDPVTLGPTVSSKRALALSAKVFSPLGYLALVVTGNAEGGEEEVYYHTGMKMKLFKDNCDKRCVLSYSGARILSGSKNPEAIDKDDLSDIEQSNKWKKSSSNAEMPMVSYHYGTTYSERMASAGSDLEGLTLNDLYAAKARGALLAVRKL
mmetsp:Transcript_10898/g.23624  ORF Transcript_10898/g.23624 Transcript_10898/m.23624 type:complete len:638 (-) Transcript_10898:157-2070(-)|eukprot:CAMPEP_0172529246 /NCGR_PEP_ID=MMETSP1067-20121228/3371_1 /TAXON_ID=265564 ORGANISM="Thalassiosira punctigera, Strain Tpunct2005C2" /NCGR_SAMPLE_ID=MMETSP1067 /ASSEMBLY_ACC=CAM_ASM_000444 /LENGTH=637 /DNA_ID=CAMNT_0013313267 /DNA_START=61 /DNA_END=1974 /DNA_ORIENTATION=+